MHLLYVVTIAIADEMEQEGIFMGGEVIGVFMILVSMLTMIAAITLHIFRCQFGLPAGV